MFARLVLILGILICGYIAVIAFTAPEQLLLGAEIEISGPSARNEVRAQYGGFYLLVGIFLMLSLARRIPEQQGLALLLISVGGVFLGRVISLLIEGPAVFAAYSDSIKVFYAFDIVISGLAIFALYRLKRKDVGAPAS